MSGLILRAESISRFFWDGYDKWATQYVTPARRKQFTWFSSLVAFIVGNFLAYHSVQDDLRAAQIQIASLKTAQGATSEAVLVEAAGTNQITATPVSAPYSIVISQTSGGGVILRPSGAIPITVNNVTSLNLLIYPPEGAKFDEQSVNTPVFVVGHSGPVTFVCITKVRCTS